MRYWLPYVIPRLAEAPAGTIVFTAVARLKPGATLAQAEAEGTAAARAAPRHRLTELFFGKGGPVVVHARALADDITAPARPALSVLAVAVALVLVISCANVTNLLLSRGLTRQRELAIRAAVGGSRARIARQLFTENAIFAIAGSTLGLMLAWWLVRALPAIAPPRLPRLDAVTLDGSVLTFWALTALLAALAAGLAPAARGARVDLRRVQQRRPIVKQRIPRRARPPAARHPAGRRSGLRRHPDRGASLLARSFVRLMGVDNGYTAGGVLIASVEAPAGATDARTDQFIDATLARLRSMPGVTAAGAGAMIPLMARTAIEPFALPESVAGGKPAHGRALVYWVTPGYAEALGLRLREGRFFAGGDARAGTLATIVNQEFVRQHLAARPIVGREPRSRRRHQVIAEIVGVVGNVLKDGNDRQPQPELLLRPRLAWPADWRRGAPRDPRERQPRGARAGGPPHGAAGRTIGGGRTDRAAHDDRGRVARWAAIRGGSSDRLREPRR